MTIWEVYVAYIHKCVQDNYINDIDPAHYEMEWNHFLPQCIFGDQPIGHWLTKRQHAIASALQTLAFRKNCMCGWHKHCLPEQLLNLAWPIFCNEAVSRGKRNAEELHKERDENGKSIRMIKHNAKLHAKKDERGNSIHMVRNAKKVHAEKNENGKSIRGLRYAERLHREKDELGRSVVAMRVNSQRWKCLVTGHISNSGGLSAYQKKRGIDTTQRERVG